MLPYIFLLKLLNSTTLLNVQYGTVGYGIDPTLPYPTVPYRTVRLAAWWIRMGFYLNTV